MQYLPIKKRQILRFMKVYSVKVILGQRYLCK